MNLVNSMIFRLLPVTSSRTQRWVAHGRSKISFMFLFHELIRCLASSLSSFQMLLPLTKVTIVEHIQPHSNGSWKAGELLVQFHSILDKHPFLYPQVKICAAIFLQPVTNVLGFWNPRKIISIQLDRRKKVSVVTVKGHAHSLALLRVSISTEYKLVLLGMHLAEVDHLLQPLQLGGQDQDIISVGKGTKEVSTNSAAITTAHQRLNHRI